MRPRVALIAWHILATAKPCHDLGAGYFASLKDPERETRLEALGHRVTLDATAA